LKSLLRLSLILVFASQISACASLFADDQDDSAAPPNAVQGAAETQQSPAEVATTAPATTALATPTTGLKTATTADIDNHIPAEQALGWLKNGNRRYLTGHLRNDGQSRKDRLRLKSDQYPHSIIMSCSDSRVPPEIIFDEKLGELYVIRNAGPSVDTGSVSSIEYALSHYGPQNLVLMAHTSCEFTGEPWSYLDSLAQKLSQSSPLIAERLKNGQLTINKALYHLDSGQVEFKP
jgi:carbonic anhydrase